MIKKIIRGIGYGIIGSMVLMSFYGIGKILLDVINMFLSWLNSLPIQQQTTFGIIVIFGAVIVAGIVLSIGQGDY